MAAPRAAFFVSKQVPKTLRPFRMCSCKNNEKLLFLSPVESALTKHKFDKSFRMRSYKKQGEGGWLEAVGLGSCLNWDAGSLRPSAQFAYTLSRLG
jgi:hypothetical protein